jgi:gas vesicle protein
MGEIAKLATEEKKVSIADEMTKENIGEFMQGILKSTGVGSFNLEALLVCIYEEDQAALILYEAVQILSEAYAQKDIGEAVGGIIALVAAVQQARQGLPACESIDKSAMSWTKFDKMVEVCEDPKDHMKVIGKDILMNGRVITKDIAKALDSFRSGEWEQFGEQIGDALMKTTEVSAVNDISKQNFAEFMEGMLKATGVGSFNLEALLVCVYEEDQAALILYEAVQILEEAYAQKDIGEAVGGVIALVAAVQQARQGLPACEAIDKSAMSWTKFDQVVATCEDPKDHMEVIGKDIVMNGRVITKDIGQALDSFRSGKFEEFGEKLGDALVKTTTLHSTENKEQVAKFQQGFLKATGVGSFNLEALLVCVYEEDQAALILYEAVQILSEAWSQKDPMEAIGGVIALVAAVQQARQGLPACEAIDTGKANWSNVDQILSVLKAPKKNWNTIENDVVTNGAQIVTDLETSLPAYDAKDYVQFGSTIGDIMMLMTMPTNESDLFLF